MINYWYIARANELFIDTDNVSKSITHAHARLQGAIEYRKLDVDLIMSRQSKSKNHLHTIIILNTWFKYDIERYVWEIILHGDIYRGCCNIMRQLRWNGAGINPCDVLISPFQDFISKDKKYSRPADYVCKCVGKHTKAIMETCSVAIRLRGEQRTMGFFGKPSKNPCKIWDVTP